MKRSLGGFQPYERSPGPALDAMQGGKPFFLPNPMDSQRAMQRQGRGNALADAIRRQRQLPVPPEVF